MGLEVSHEKNTSDVHCGVQVGGGGDAVVWRAGGV